MRTRINISTGTKWEDFVGYSRAVKMGNMIEVSGTIAVDDSGNLVGGNNPYEQTKFIISKIEKVLADMGSSLADIVRTRIYVTNISQWEEIGRAHGEFFRDIKPASTMVEVKGLISPEFLVEIEISAITKE